MKKAMFKTFRFSIIMMIISACNAACFGGSYFIVYNFIIEYEPSQYSAASGAGMLSVFIFFMSLICTAVFIALNSEFIFEGE